jgi:hypothetical protein
MFYYRNNGLIFVRGVFRVKPKNNVHEKRLSRKDFLRLSAGAASAIALSSLPRMTIAEQSVGSASEDVVRELLLGAVDQTLYRE